MNIGERLRDLREAKNLSQGDIEHRTGLIRCYISRVENGHTVPSVETLEKFARALEVHTYQLFYDGDESPKPSQSVRSRITHLWGASGWPSRYLHKLRRALAKMQPTDRALLMYFAQKVAQRTR